MSVTKSSSFGLSQVLQAVRYDAPLMRKPNEYDKLSVKEFIEVVMEKARAAGIVHSYDYSDLATSLIVTPVYDAIHRFTGMRPRTVSVRLHSTDALVVGAGFRRSRVRSAWMYTQTGNNETDLRMYTLSSYIAVSMIEAQRYSFRRHVELRGDPEFLSLVRRELA